MFREKRRANQGISEDVSKNILEKGITGVLGVIGDEGYPYTVPLNYVYHEGKIYFHSATEGHKLDAIRENDKVSFTVIERDDVVSERLTTLYRSVIIFGRARILETEKEINRAAEILGLKYNDDIDYLKESIESWKGKLSCVEIEIEHISGKESGDLAKHRRRLEDI